jgi:hypothetical protein
MAGPITMRTNPVTIAEHGEHQETEKWDVGSVLYLLAMYMALPLVAGLDLRFGWSPDLSIAWYVAGGTVLAVGLGLPSWAMTTNPYIWSEVPVQGGQTVSELLVDLAVGLAGILVVPVWSLWFGWPLLRVVQKESGT